MKPNQKKGLMLVLIFFLSLSFLIIFPLRIEAICGNGEINSGEECDGSNLNGKSCTDLGYDGGTLSCQANCGFDTSDCYYLCGNGEINSGEECDGSNLNGKSCTDLGYDGGTLSCNTASCQFDTSDCYSESFSWRNHNGKNWLTPVKNQGGCGSCWAFAGLAAIEAKYNIQQNNSNINLDLSEQELVSCYEKDCNGGYTQGAYDYIAEKGVTEETCFPYTSSDGTVSSCGNMCSNPKKYYILGREKSYGNSKEKLKTYIKDEGPVVISMSMSGKFNDGIYTCEGEVLSGRHAMPIVGYNDTKKYWILKNSWGTYYQDNGYLRVAYDSQCKILFKTNPIEVEAGVPNPSFNYCEKLGYEAKVVTQEDGSQIATCKLPNGKTVAAWKFFQGKVAKEYSICSLQNMETIVKTDGKNPFSQEYAACKDGEEEVAVTDMMDLTKPLNDNTCDDGNKCTIDLSQEGTCKYINKSDGISCGENKKCQEGECVSTCEGTNESCYWEDNKCVSCSEGSECENYECVSSTEQQTEDSLTLARIKEILNNFILFLLKLVIFASIISIIYGGIRYILSKGSPQKTRRATKIVVYSIVGLVISLLSYGIINFILEIISN